MSTGVIRRWLDWRFFGSIAAVGLVFLLGMSIQANVRSRNRLYDQLQSRTATVEGLEKKLDKTTKEIIQASRQIGYLTGDVEALRAQVDQLGGVPVVNAPTTTTKPSSTRGSTTTTTRASPPPSTTSTTSPRSSSTTTTTRPPLITIPRLP